MLGLWLLLETSESAHVGLARDGAIVDSFQLPKGRDQNRRLVPGIDRLMTESNGKPNELTGVIVGIGPGSYTGLRIGLMTAKSLAYATGCELIAVPTFDTIAAVQSGNQQLDVIADGLKRTVYVQRFGPTDSRGLRSPLNELHAAKLDDWIATLEPGQLVAGPGTMTYGSALPVSVNVVPIPEEPADVYRALLRVAAIQAPLPRAEWFRMEPLYVRGSSAEEKAREKSGG